MKLLLITSNLHKLLEFSRMLKGRVELLSLRDVNLAHLDILETGKAFAENATLKIEAVRPHVPPTLALLADDSGIEVSALGGAPGIYSARFAGPKATDAENNAKLIAMLRDKSDRRARYVCALAYQPGADAPIESVEGICEGEIVDTPRGAGGFGYDPYFYLPDLGKTMSELAPDEKDAISHRGIACRLLLNRFVKELA